jgi:hypothetical protein
VTPLNDISNTLLRGPPPTTPRVIDFDRLELEEDNGNGDGWSSDDSFEEKITWSRHRNRTGPRGVTPRNIQVWKRVDLADLGCSTTSEFTRTTRGQTLQFQFQSQANPLKSIGR